MFAAFIENLRTAGLPVSLTEYLALMGAMRAHAAGTSTEDFYFLARAALVKDERHYDRFDRAFGAFFRGLEQVAGDPTTEIPEEWLRRLAEKHLSPEEMAAIEALGGFDKLMEMLRQRLAEQEKRHQGGNKMIGTAGTSPFGAYGYNPEGVRIGQKESRHRRAVKVWDKRAFADLDDDAALGPRGMKLALRRLRRFARTGAANELDLHGTIHATASNAGSLDLRMVAERHNAVKLLLLLDIGGSMDDYIRESQNLFSAVRGEFKHLDFFYFHNCIYERVWRENKRRNATQLSTFELMRTYPPDTKLIFVGDATMSPYEVTHAGGSVEHWNEEAGAVWLARLTKHFRAASWLNPVPEGHWRNTQSIQILRDLMAHRMYPMTLSGIEEMTKELSH